MIPTVDRLVVCLINWKRDYILAETDTHNTKWRNRVTSILNVSNQDQVGEVKPGREGFIFQSNRWI